MVWWPFATKPERADTLEVIDLHSGAPLLYSTRSFGNTWAEGLRSLQAELPQLRHSSMECWNQVDTDVSGSVLATWMPAIHAGMTSLTKFAFSLSVGERKITLRGKRNQGDRARLFTKSLNTLKEAEWLRCLQS